VAQLNTAVDVVVGKRRMTVEVPPVEGKSATDAASDLRQAGLTATIVPSEGTLVRPGTVLSQDPPPGSRLTPDVPVTLRVAGPLSLLFAGTSGAFVLVAGAGVTFWQRAQLIKVTRSLLRIRPSFDRNAVDAAVAALPQVAASVRLAAHLEVGDVQSDGPLPIIRKEIRHD
jgi:hypothetical protein